MPLQLSPQKNQPLHLMNFYPAMYLIIGSEMKIVQNLIILWFDLDLHVCAEVCLFK